MGLAVLALVVGLAGGAEVQAGPWNPAGYGGEDTLTLVTDVPGEGLHEFPVWLVVLDGEVYVRLGRRAADRFERNRSQPYVTVVVAGQRFEQVEGVSVPEMAARVSQAMADKYAWDLVIRWLAHPLTLRLVPKPPGVPGAAP